MLLARPLLLSLLVAACALVGCDHQGASSGASEGTLLSLVETRGEIATTSGAVQRARLQSVLRQGGFTFFAPSERAWERLGPETVGAYLRSDNEDLLAEVIRRHLVPGVVTADRLVDGASLQPLEGPPLPVAVDAEGTVYVAGAKVTTADIEAADGVIHVLDRVVRDHLSLDERLRVIPLLSTLTTALNRAGLMGLVADPDQPVTVFAPFESAFDGLAPESKTELLSTANRSILERVLRQHVVAGRVQLEALQDGQELRTIEGEVLRVRREGRLVYVGSARVVVGDVETASGTLHLVDDVFREHLRVLERVRLSPTLSWLEQAFVNAGLSEAPLPAPFTLFAPSADALNRLGPEVEAALLQDTPLLHRVTRYAFVPGMHLASDLVPGLTLETAEGHPAMVTANTQTGGIRFGGGAVQVADLLASDGVLHLVDAVARPPLTVWEQLLFSGLLGFREGVRQVQLQERLSGPAPLTIFAPHPDSFAVVQQTSTLTELSQVVRVHIAEGAYGPTDLSDGQILQSLHGDHVLTMSELFDPRLGGRVWSANGTPILSPTVATNGVVWFAVDLFATP